MKLLNSIKKLKKSWDNYQPLIEVVIYRENILHNLKTFQTAFPNTSFAPVIKSNAYGHGLIEVASILDKQNLPFFMIDSLFEAKALRHEGIKTPLLTLGYTTVENINGQNLKNIAFGITSLDQLKLINAKLKRLTNFHLKMDTGMRRQGLMPEQLDEALKIIKNNPRIKIEGICSHLADADGENDIFSNRQIMQWNTIVAKAEKILKPIKFKHLAATAGTAYTEKIDANVARLGIGLYGFSFSPHNQLHLKPALEVKSIISSIRTLKTGESIGYNITFTAPSDMRVATVPVGYAEGINRLLSNKGAMTIEGKICPIVGRVSMNITSISVTAVTNAHLEQKVTVISKNPSDPNSVENIAKLCNTIPYEVLVKISNYLKRTVI